MTIGRSNSRMSLCMNVAVECRCPGLLTYRDDVRTRIAILYTKLTTKVYELAWWLSSPQTWRAPVSRTWRRKLVLSMGTSWDAISGGPCLGREGNDGNYRCSAPPLLLHDPLHEWNLHSPLVSLSMGVSLLEQQLEHHVVAPASIGAPD